MSSHQIQPGTQGQLICREDRYLAGLGILGVLSAPQYGKMSFPSSGDAARRGDWRDWRDWRDCRR
jgi:hypothetical protein